MAKKVKLEKIENKKVTKKEVKETKKEIKKTNRLLTYKQTAILYFVCSVCWFISAVLNIVADEKPFFDIAIGVVFLIIGILYMVKWNKDNCK